MATERNPYEAIPEVQVIPVAEGGTEVEMGENVNIDVSPDGGVIVSFEDTLEVNQKETTARINALGVERDLWNEFLGIRKKLKANNSSRGVNTLLNRIEKFVSKGQSATAMIEEANAQGWKTVYEEKEEKHVQPTARQLLDDYSWADGLISESGEQNIRDVTNYLPDLSQERKRD